MPGHFSCEIQQEQMLLLPEKAIFWARNRTLLLADCHLGKVGHFRKAGIAVNPRVHVDDLGRLSRLVAQWKPERLLILGDLFHSHYNSDWEAFAAWLALHAQLRVVLVKGNHDILPEELFYRENVELCPDILTEGPFVFSHIPLQAGSFNGYNLSGHLHPSVRLQGGGRQSLTLPCFYFGAHAGLLPAFGRFTGTARVQVYPGDRVFAVLDSAVLPLAPNCAPNA